MVRKTLIVFLAVVILSCAATSIQAQRQTYRGTYRSVRQLILRIENRTDLLRNSLNQSAVNRERRENLDGLLTDLATSVAQLRVEFERRAASAADAREVINRAAHIDQVMQQGVNGSSLRGWPGLRTDLNQLAAAFNMSWQVVSRTYRENDVAPYASNHLTGTYRFDPLRSDDPTQAADRAAQSAASRDRVRLRDQIAARLESPDQIAIELRGREVTLASSRAPQITFSADGIERVDSTEGQTVRARATLNGDQLIVSSTGDAGNQFNVTFDPIDNGRSLSVTRRVYVPDLARPVIVQSVYERTSDLAQFEINPGPQRYPTSSNSNNAFVVPNGERLVAVLNGGVSTETARDGDRFRLTVRQPYQFEGATIEGHVSNVQRSGRVTGRSQMTLNFDMIRLRDGRSHRFAGIVESVRSPQGEAVRVDNEGGVRDNSQTTRTAQRAAIGTAVGAIIGAIAGGGKGAAIGAIVGAGGGAGSVYVQGRDDLELASGAELTIRSTGPR